MAPEREVKIPNTIRIRVPEFRKQECNKDFMVKTILFELLRSKVEDVLAFHDHLANGYVDITYVSEDVYSARVSQMRVVVNEDRAKWSKIVKGLGFDVYVEKSTLIVYMYNSHVEERELKMFLDRYCRLISDGVKLRDTYGLWTGKWRFSVAFRKNQLGDPVLPPGSFFLGPHKGLCYVPGKLHVCWTCGETGHLKDQCVGMRCRHCDERDHVSKDCVKPKLCSLCGKGGHLYNACPGREASFAEKVRSARGTARAPDKPSVETKGHVLQAPKMAAVENKGKMAEKDKEKDMEKTDEWEGASASQEAEMAELAGGGLKRPSQESEGMGTPLRRMKAGGGASNRALVPQESMESGDDDVLLVEAQVAVEGASAAAPSATEKERGEPPPLEEKTDKTEEVLLPGFEKVLGATD